MNLPHKEPILFAKEIIQKDEKSAQVRCEFPYAPSLAMILEAAAQSSSALSDKINSEGFLVAANALILHKKVEDKELLIQINSQMQMGNMNIFSFEIENIAEGKFTIYVK